ncbi:hypothetical protein PSN45_002159 [Yamadazyma tenuis]|uniref:Zn(2)-C6 fungal-type domain-containing protein n=1 Tax=Candida tenuis (strain ATCC 10573 / BCRC 21748 / CBS 615 / JCM 9827 / NBRC 10315 / NRRL Y-1498 / VKM Y-70) TaxID=590646 RepID=G3BBW7_CANTC|nr:uncharacterized protein CANTEDRAFT_95564 [Yamadazyma tenuis ATCC 10573]EGV60099.1 hypothetical protein CANTEDRAFT_95564 [Yamadazyma tenuis ATCC 10573]WEJ94667.1 hypothetical protein PSN45_002159 [Yamadazyma tenuis]
MTSVRGKRQRRSYSCGPCKLLKIKCDLTLPCSSCQKFSREDKCQASPPQPPTESELRIIEERKQRMSRRKKSTSTSSPDNTTNNTTVGAADDFQSPVSDPDTSFIVTKVRLQHPNLSMSSKSQSPYQDSSYSDVSGLRDIQGYFEQRHVSFSLISDSWFTLKLYFRRSGEPIFGNLATELAKSFTIDQEDVNLLKFIYPNKEALCQLLMGHFKGFKEDLFYMMDYRLLVRTMLEISDKLHSTEYNTPLVINSIDARTLSLLLPVLASGLVTYPHIVINPRYKNSDILSSWILISKKLREHFKKTDSLLDITYLMVWYFEIDNYYHSEGMLNENHYEYNNLLSNLLFDRKYMEHIISTDLDFSTLGEERETEFRVILSYWLRVRVIELNVLYFQYKSSLLRSNHILKNSIVPDDKMLKFVYGFQGFQSDDIMTSIYCTARHYYNQFNSVTSHACIREVVSSYLKVYGNSHSVTGKEIDQYELSIKNNRPIKIDYETTSMYFKSQIFILSFVKWLTFLKIEQGYFPSLRFVSYLTSMSASLNHYIFLDNELHQQSQGTESLISVLPQFHSYYPLEYLMHACMVQQIFLLSLKVFVNREDNTDNIVDLKELYDKMYNKFMVFSNKFVKDFNSVNFRPRLYRAFINVFVDMNTVHDLIEFDSQLEIEEFFQLISKHIPDIRFYIDSYFGCKSTMINYLSKLWYLFSYIRKSKRSDVVKITSKINFTNELIMSYQDKFTGFEISVDKIEDYIHTVVDPVIGQNPRESTL